LFSGRLFFLVLKTPPIDLIPDPIELKTEPKAEAVFERNPSEL